MECPSCDTRNSEAAHFCTNCGQPLGAPFSGGREASPKLNSGDPTGAAQAEAPSTLPTASSVWYRPPLLWWETIAAALLVVIVVAYAGRNANVAFSYIRLDRIAGEVSYVILSLAVAGGIFLAIDAYRGSRFYLAIAYAHPLLLLAAGFSLGLHFLGLLLAGFPAYQLLVPFTTDYRPVWVGIGMLATYSGLAIVASTYVMSRIGFPTWRRIHHGALGVWILATIHDVFASSEAASGLPSGPWVGFVILIIAIATWRIWKGSAGDLAQVAAP